MVIFPSENTTDGSVSDVTAVTPVTLPLHSSTESGPAVNLNQVSYSAAKMFFYGSVPSFLRFST